MNGQPPGSLLFLSQRLGSNSWAQRPDIIDAWRRRNLLDVMPHTLEFAPNLACNADCPDCPFRHSRLEICHGREKRGMLSLTDDRSAASPQSARRVLEAAAEAGVRGVLWTGGGEPTIWGPLASMLRYSSSLGMVNSLYTNGVQVGLFPHMAKQLLDVRNRMVFIRVSINAVSPSIIRRHWGVRDPEDIFPQFDGLHALLKARAGFLPHYWTEVEWIPAIQISTIIDRRNIEDLMGICHKIAEIYASHRETLSSEDILVVRPLTNHRTGIYSTHDHDEWVISQILEVCGQHGAGRKVLADAGVTLHLGFGLDQVESGRFNSYGEALCSEYDSRDLCWANGVFLTVGADARVHFCTEHNCDPAWAVGNLLTHSVREIYHSDQRKEILARVHGERMGPTVLEPNTRMSRLNRVAKAVQCNVLTEADIASIQKESSRTPPLLLS